MTTYVVGLIFDALNEHVLLIRKNRPSWQKGKLNGVGGKVETTEIPYDAMVRECEEECGLLLYNWLLVDVFTDNSTYEVYFFTSQTTALHKATSKTDQLIEVHRIKDLFGHNFGMDLVVYPTNVLILDYYKKWSNALC